MRQGPVLLAALALVAIPTLAGAHAGNNDPNVVHACIGNASQVVRIVGVSGSCVSAPASKAETPAHWAIQGPQGAPGTNGTNGIDATRPDPPCYALFGRYANCGNGTVTDSVTGLIWLQQADCLFPGGDGVLYVRANQAAAALANGQCNLTDHSSPGDWRLPTKDEWLATTARARDLQCGELGEAGDPALTNDFGTQCLLAGPSSFTGVMPFFTPFYWSSTTDETDPMKAWIVPISGGIVISFDKLNGGQVWPVRGGPR